MGDDVEYHELWNVESVFQKNVLSNVHIILAIIEFFKNEGKVTLLLPRKLEVDVIRKEYNGNSTNLTLQLIKENTKKDGFDSLIESTPEKQEYVKTNLKEFVNKQLSKLN